jgi:hypothetical protein
LQRHNRVVDLLLAEEAAPEGVFEQAVRVVRWHYQWLVVHDFLERLTPAGTVARVLKEPSRFFRPADVPFLPLEFAAAAFQFAPVLMREDYSYNRVFRPTVPRLARASLDMLMRFTSVSGEISGQLPGGFDVLPSNWVIDWRRWFDFEFPPGQEIERNQSRRIGPRVTPKLHLLSGALDGKGRGLAFHQLRRGVMLGLPSGQAVALAIAAHDPHARVLTARELGSGPDANIVRRTGFDQATPLWYYLLKEAEIRERGERLGYVGAVLVAEVIIGLLRSDPTSYLNAPNWAPTLPSEQPGTFFMTDLLQLAGDLSPLDGNVMGAPAPARSPTTVPRPQTRPAE